MISGSRTAYAYLTHTITRFYPPEELRDIMALAGFKNVWYRKLFFGVAAIHKGVKPSDLNGLRVRTLIRGLIISFKGGK